MIDLLLREALRQQKLSAGAGTPNDGDVGRGNAENSGQQLRQGSVGLTLDWGRFHANSQDAVIESNHALGGSPRLHGHGKAGRSFFAHARTLYR